MGESLIIVEGVSKKFCRSLKRSLWYGMKDLGSELLWRHHNGKDILRPDEFWAVKDVSFEVRRGECLGLIGQNGAGKTTLLRMLNGLIKPDQGCIEMRGKVGALIALGAGFSPILTGRENIYVNASVLGLNKSEIDAKIDEIIEFSEIGEFIDSPVQNYSSGMQVRLGFSIATSLEPDILILDEILAVGDASFRDKCYRRIDNIREQSAVIFVSHNTEQLARICDCGLVLSKGHVCGSGIIDECVSIYDNINNIDSFSYDEFISINYPLKSFEIKFLETLITSCQSLNSKISIYSEDNIADFILRFTFYNKSGAISCDCNLDAKCYCKEIKRGMNIWYLVFPVFPLKNGKYFVSINIIDSRGRMLVWAHKQISCDVVGGYVGAIADCQLHLGIWDDVFSKSDSHFMSEDGKTI